MCELNLDLPNYLITWSLAAWVFFKLAAMALRAYRSQDIGFTPPHW